MPVVISFTVETDGRLPTGQSLGDAIRQVDEESSGYVSYFMINCAHPSHFDRVVAGDQPWAARIRGLRANASRMSHAELNEAPDLDAGNPAELAQEYAALKSRLRHLNVLGGCCGTDHRHLEAIATVCMPLFRVTGASAAGAGPIAV
jgi:homocysteine S-methyltransferase